MVKLELKTSGILNSGNGLFVSEDVVKGDILGEYNGRRFSPNKILSGYRRDYSFSTPSDVMVSPADDCLFRFANDIVDLEQSLLHKKVIRYNNLSYNIDWYIDKDERLQAKALGSKLGKNRYMDSVFINLERVYIKATQDIKAGSELFINYDEGYWNCRVTIRKYRREMPPVSGEALAKYLDDRNTVYWSRMNTLD